MGISRAVRLASLLLAAACPAWAQTGSGHGSISGTVVTATTGLPITGAVVILESATDASVVASGGGPFLGRSLVSTTDGDGAYRFAALNPGTYRLMVRHLGYRPAVLQVDVTQPAPLRVSVGLVVTPIRLEAMDTRATTTAPYARMRAPADELRYGRLDAEQFRDERFLEGDAAVLTHSDVMEAVTLGETDLFRAVQRLPGVSTRDDFTAAIWTRGASWSETRVYFDGLPLFNPVHAIGVFAGVNPDAVGAATFHPGVRPAGIGEGAAGVLNVTSRRPTAPGVSGLGELSVISARAAADWESPGGRTAAMFAARRSYVDLVTRLAESLGADSGTYIPYAFYDLTGRVDADLGRGYALEASGLVEQDHVSDAVPGLLRPTRGTWGNSVGRVSLVSPLGAWHLRTTAGISDFRGNIGPRNINNPAAEVLPTHAPMNNGVRATILSAEVTPNGANAAPSWSAGVQLSVQRQRYTGQYPRPYPVAVLPDSLILREQVPIVSLWGERRWALGPHVALEAGLRLDAHRALRNAPGLGVGPKLSVRATPPHSRLTFTAAVARSFQYTQALAPAGPSIGPDLYVTDVWLLADDTIPVVRSDIATVGVESYIGLGWAASVNLYDRHSTGVAVPEPAPGSLQPDAATVAQYGQRAIFVPAQNLAQGIEFSLRKLVGRTTMSASYSLGRSIIRDRTADSRLGYAQYDYPSAADRRHVLNLTAMTRVGTQWRLGGAFTATSGAPFSRFLIGSAPCDSTNGGTCPPADSSAQVIEAPNAQRAAGYASLSLMADWSRAVGHVRIGAFLQLRNVLNSANAVTYIGSVRECFTDHPPTLIAVQGQPGVCDRFDKGVPILPLAGLRIAF